MDAEFLHACLVAQDASFGPLGTWVDSEDCEPSTVFLQDMNAELVYAGALAGSRNAADADADTVAGVGETLLDDFLRYDLVLGNGALDQRNGLSQNGDVALQDALHIVVGRETASHETVAVEVRIDDRDRTHAAVHGQACIFGIVLRMFHCLVHSYESIVHSPSHQSVVTSTLMYCLA